MKKIIIAIDGFSSTGKSTIAKKVSKILNYKYIDTGAMYRAVALFAHRNHWVLPDGNIAVDLLVSHLDQIHIEFHFDENQGFAPVFLNGENVEKEIRSLEISSLVSLVASVAEVRRKLVVEQQRMGKNKGIVMDGRDIATTVFPDAELKIFMTASDQVRAQRRYKELCAKGEKVSFEDILENITRRDKIDSERSISPLRKAEDAIEIDNSSLTIEEQVEEIVRLAREKMS